MDHEIDGLQVRAVAEEAGSANLSAGALDGGSDIEEVGVPKQRELGVRKRDALRERRANQQQTRGLERAFGGKAGGRIFRFAEQVGHFILGESEDAAAGFTDRKSTRLNSSHT